MLNTYYFIIIYSLYTLTIYIIKATKIIRKSLYLNSKSNYIIVIVFIIFFLSCPPIGIFFIKIYLIIESTNYLSIIIKLSIIFYIIARAGYIKIIIHIINITEKIYNIKELSNKKLIRFIVITIILFIL